MRLLQLATAPEELIDLHPNVTVVTGLDAEGRRVLAAAVVGLAHGQVTGPRGLLEAHGVLFDLAPELLALLDIPAGGVNPVVTADDLPSSHTRPLAQKCRAAEQALAELEERWAAAADHDVDAQAAVASAAELVTRARRAVDEFESDAGTRRESITALTALLAQAHAERGRLAEELATVGPAARLAAAQRAEVEAATAEVRDRRHQAGARCSELAAQLEQAMMARDPGAAAAADAAAAALVEVEAEVAAEAEAERQAADQVASDVEAAVDWLARVQHRIDELTKLLAAFAPADVGPVAAQLESVRTQDVGVLVPMREAQDLAVELTAVEVELEASAGVGSMPGRLTEGRARLEDARQALLEAEQAVRHPEVDREQVDRLEKTHANLLEATDKAGGRLGGARAQRRVDDLRSAEQALLDEMGFTSYSDYMMGYSLLHVDPEKESALDTARLELLEAEDAWRALYGERDAELQRAETMERRRLLIEQAHALIGRSVPAGSVVDELRGLREQSNGNSEMTERLREALDESGVALGDETIERDDLLLVAEAWLEEAAGAVRREEEIRAALVALHDECDEAQAAVDAELARAAAQVGPTPEERRTARLVAAREQARTTEVRCYVDMEAGALAATLADELAAAVEAEQIAADAAREADAAVAAAAAHEEVLLAELRRVDDELAEAERAEADVDVQLRAMMEIEAGSAPERLAEELTDAESALTAAQERSTEAARLLVELDDERQQSMLAVAALQEELGAEEVDDDAVIEEIEWYLLARLAAQRAVSLGGALPLLLDDALRGLDQDDLLRVLGRLDRMAETVQVILVTDDPAAVSWALLAGAERAAVVRPEPSYGRADGGQHAAR